MTTKGTSSSPPPPLEARMKDSFLFANTIQFLRLFHEVLNIDLLTPSEFEDILLEAPVQGEATCALSIIYKKIIKALHRSRAPNDDTLVKSLAREYRRHLVKEPPYLLVQPEEMKTKAHNSSREDESSDVETTSPSPPPEVPSLPAWGSISAEAHLQTLHDLCSFLLTDLDRFALLSGYRDGGAAWRTDSLGADRQGAIYWFIGDCWLYRESSARRNQSSTPLKQAASQGRGRKGGKQRKRAEPEREPELELDLSSEWECVAWDTASWRHFLEESSPFLTSRRPADRELQVRLTNELGPAACELLGREERRKRRREEELQRAALWETRQRSSRIAARERLHQQLVLHESATIPSPVTFPGRRSARAGPGMSANSSTISPGAAAAAAASPPKLTREERMAMREKRAQRRETEQIINELMLQQEQAQKDLEAHSLEPVNVDGETGTDDEGKQGGSREPVTPVSSTVPSASAARPPSIPHSPIKLLLKIGPHGTARTDLFIANERVEKDKNEQLEMGGPTRRPMPAATNLEGGNGHAHNGTDHHIKTSHPTITMRPPSTGSGMMAMLQPRPPSHSSAILQPRPHPHSYTHPQLHPRPRPQSYSQLSMLSAPMLPSQIRQSAPRIEDRRTAHFTDQSSAASPMPVNTVTPTEREIVVANLLTDIASLLNGEADKGEKGKDIFTTK